MPVLLGLLGVLGFSFTLPVTRAAVDGLDPAFVGLGRAAVAAVPAAVLLAVWRERLPDRVTIARLALVESGHSRDEAYRIVQENAQQAWDTGIHFRELLGVAAPNLDLDAVFDAGAFVRQAGAIVGRLDSIA